MHFLQILLAGLIIMLATALGAGAVFAFNRIGSALYAAMLALCAGMMTFSAVEMVTVSHAEAGHRIAFATFVMGMAVFCLLDRLLPHAHATLLGAEMPHAKRKATLLVSSMTLHNIPEGFAVAAAFAGSSSLGWLVTTCIALQDIPEGLVVAGPIACQGVPLRRCFLWGLFSGFAELAAALCGFWLLSAASRITPWAIGFAAGTMSYVVLFELLPDAVRNENRRQALAAFVGGVALAFGLSAIFGS